MSQIALASDYIIRSGNETVKMLLSGKYVIGADLTEKLLLQNAFHYNLTKRALEVYTLKEIPNENRFSLHFDSAIMSQLGGINDLMKSIYSNYDVWFWDKENILDTSKIIGKYGVYKNR